MPVHYDHPTIDRGDTRTLTISVTANDAAVDPDTLTLTIRTPAGVSTTYTYGASAIVRDSEGEYHYDLTFTQTGAWTYEWRSTVPTQVQGETVQVGPSPLDVDAGTDAPYFTIGEARRLSPLQDAETYPDAAIDAARVMAESALEDACSVAFVPREFTVQVDGRGRCDLLLPIVRPLTISAATIDGTAVVVGDVELYDDGRVYLERGWGAGRRNITLTGTHGYPSPPPRVARAAMLLAKRFLVDSPVSDRATSMTTEDGTTQFLVTAGVRQAVFDVPECNAVVELYGMLRESDPLEGAHWLTFGPRAQHFGKFYTAHLADPELSDETREVMALGSGLRFHFEDGRVRWERAGGGDCG